MMEHAELRDRLEAYALGALDPEEAEELTRHLRSCAGCRAELDVYRRVVAALPASLAAASPLRVHPSLKRRVLAAVPVPPARRRRPFRIGVWPAAVAVAALMFAGSTAWALHLQRQLAAEVVKAPTQEKLDRMLDQGEQLRVLEVLDSGTTVKRPLRAVDRGSPAYGKLWTRGDDRDVVVMVNKLPQPPAGARYELMVTSGGQTRDAGTLRVDQDGFAMLLFSADHPGPSYQRAVVEMDGKPMLGWEGSR